MKTINPDQILTLIPARSESQRIKKKNIIQCAGQPLIAWTIQSALNSSFVNECYITTNCEEIAEISKKYNAKVPFLRPEKLSGNQSTTIDAIKHFLDQIQKKYEYILLLQPTSPLRRAEDINNAITQFLNSDADSIVSITEMDPHVNWKITFNEKNKITSSHDRKKLSQDFIKQYILNGAIFFGKISYVLKNNGFLGENTTIYKMDREKSVDIDNIIDLKFAEYLIQN